MNNDELMRQLITNKKKYLLLIEHELLYKVKDYTYSIVFIHIKTSNLNYNCDAKARVCTCERNKSEADYHKVHFPPTASERVYIRPTFIDINNRARIGMTSSWV